MAILEDKDGVFWFGGFNGLDRLDPELGTIKNYSRNQETGTSISSNTIFSIYQSQSGDLWIGTNSGLNHFNPTTERFTVFTEADGLAHNGIVGILEDDEGNLWLSTRHGLSKFNPETKRSTNFYVEDGLQSSEFNRFSYKKRQSGEMVFGGVNGFNLFDPSFTTDSETPPEVILTNLKLFNEPVLVKQDGRLQKVIHHADVIELQPDDDTFSIHFAALEYRNAANVRYRYKMDGLDLDWLQTTSQQRLATYTDLSPTTYTFRVQASFDGERWGNEKEIELIVFPYFWETGWFRFALIGAGILLIYLISMARIAFLQRGWEADQRAREALVLRKKNQELSSVNRELERLSEEKDNFLDIVAHDLRSPLGGIKLLVGILSTSSDKLTPEKKQQNYAKIDHSVTHMLEIINSLLQQKGGTVHQTATTGVSTQALLNQLIDSYKVEAQKKGMTFKMEIDESEDLILCGEETHLVQIFDNLLSNALKYSYTNSYIEINCKRSNQFAEISIKDEGQGLTDQDKTQIFKKYARLSAKPTGGEASVGLGLYSVKRLTEMLGGAIRAESAGKDQGATFIVTLPSVEIMASGRAMPSND